MDSQDPPAKPAWMIWKLEIDPADLPLWLITEALNWSFHVPFTGAAWPQILSMHDGILSSFS